MKNYIYDAMWSQELEDIVEANKAKPLIMEMFYKYGLRVYAVTAGGKITEWIDDEEKTLAVTNYKFMLTLDGLPYCQVFVNEHSGKTDYCFYSPYFEKQRGTDRDDKRTVRASKISGLMRMLDKYNCVKDSPEGVLEQASFTYMGNGLFNHYMTEHRQEKPITMIDRDLTMRLAEAYFDEVKLKPDTKQQIKEWFDSRKKWEQTERQALDKVKETFGKEFYILAESYQDVGICIGKGKLNFKDDGIRDCEFEVTDSFQRVADISEYPEFEELKAPLTMYKVYMESKYPSQMEMLKQINKNIIGGGGGYNSDLNMYGLSLGGSMDAFGMSLLVIPV